MEEFFQFVPRERIYALTGTQFLQFNSLFQLYALKRDQSPLLQSVSDLLFMPDLFNFFLTGKKTTEFTCATTSQLYNPIREKWEDELFDVLGVPVSVMQDIVTPGTKLSTLNKSICEETGIREIPVIAVASHDTASAVAAVPAEDKNWAFISSGTWSCMGIELQRPILDDRALNLNFTNEGGVEGTFRFLKNIMGLWLLQECRRIWAKKKLYSYQSMMDAAETAPVFQSILDPDWTDFLNPADMTESIRLFCLKTNQCLPETLGSYVRCILESLAMKYRFVLEQLESISSQSIERIHIIGGGANNRLLCQFTANATSRPVFAGPSEATAAGNIL
jgi:rhamnulokinase